MKKVLFYLFVLLNVTICSGQFIDSSNLLNSLGIKNSVSTSVFVPGAGISFYDINYDGWDDLTIAGVDSNDVPQPPIILINNQGTFELADFVIPTTGMSYIFGLLWLDYDNDGDPDLLLTKQAGKIELWQNDGDFNFTNVALAAELHQFTATYAGVCAADYDHDGFLDLYITKYYSAPITGLQFENVLYRNNGDGTFSNVTVEAGVYLSPNPSLQPVFVDVNNDGWEDLFICVDRVPFPNELFINNGDGTFERVTTTSGVETYMDGMSSTVGDWNNDSYLDIYVTNSPIGDGHAFYVNNGDGTFSDLALELGVELMLDGWAALFIDYDNDMWQDLLVSSMWENLGTQAFRNNQGESLTPINLWPQTPELITETFGLAAGDVNNDGYFDFVSNNRFPQANQLMINDGGTNSYLSVSLEGTLANRDGIGTWIHCYAGGTHQVRYTLCGENYAGQSSRKNIFGLDTLQVIDSLILNWNIGTHEVYYNVQVNQHLHLIEGASFSLPFDIDYVGDLFLCEGESLTLSAGNYNSYLWNTGQTGQTISVDQPGNYWVTVTNQFGISIDSNPVVVEMAPAPEIETEVSNISCFGETDGSVSVEIINNQNIQSIIWNTGDTANIIENLEEGIFSFIGINSYGCQFFGNAEIVNPDPIFAEVLSNEALCFGENSGSVIINPFGGTPPYHINWMDINPDSLYADSYQIQITDTNLCLAEVMFVITEPDSLYAILSTVNAVEGDNLGEASLTIFGGLPPYSISWSNGVNDLVFVENLVPGDYNVIVTDEQGCSIVIEFVISVSTNHEALTSKKVKVFPNPFNHFVLLDGCHDSIVNIYLRDLNGKLIWQRMDDTCPEKLNLSSLSKGLYFLSIENQDSVNIFKLVKTE